MEFPGRFAIGACLLSLVGIWFSELGVLKGQAIAQTPDRRGQLEQVDASPDGRSAYEMLLKVKTNLQGDQDPSTVSVSCQLLERAERLHNSNDPKDTDSSPSGFDRNEVAQRWLTERNGDLLDEFGPWRSANCDRAIS